MFQFSIKRASKSRSLRPCRFHFIKRMKNKNKKLFDASYSSSLTPFLLPTFCSSSRMLSSFANSPASAFSGSNTTFIEVMYNQWKIDPTSVHSSWQAYFGNNLNSQVTSAAQTVNMSDTIKVIQLARAFQVRGHYLANINPLGLEKNDELQGKPQDLNPEFWGFTPQDYDRIIDTSFLKVGGLQSESGLTLRQIIKRFQQIYCGNIGYQYMHINSPEICDWIRTRIETRDEKKFSKKDKLIILDRMTWAEEFEKFLGKKQATAKRFSLEGGESSIPGLKAAIKAAAEQGVDEVAIGMPHRGRLNVLSTVLRKPLEAIFYDFLPQNSAISAGVKEVSGDVKYHLGYRHMRSEDGILPVKINLLANPSHLEAVNPVVCGKIHAKQFYKDDPKGKTVMGVHIHGDASVAGQGVVYETLGMSQVDGFAQGGTFHLVINNQIGFTTGVKESRSMEYCSDIGKSLNCPIFHVNGDDPEAVSWVCKLAAEFRCKFHSDVVVDLVCYRRHGHNEIDEPMFTQPIMYNKIKNHPTTLELYRKRLLEENNGITAEEIQKVTDKVHTYLEEKYLAAYNYKPSLENDNYLLKKEQWSSMFANYQPTQSPDKGETGVSIERLKKIGISNFTTKNDFNIHRRLKNTFQKKLKSIESGTGIDWGTAEALAFGNLLMKATHVRLTGEDVERGTFTHRMAVLVDQKNEQKYTPLNHLSDEQAHFSIYNSILSEYACVGFELGYSMENPNALIVWEAQYGDFINGAQIMIDNFISCGEVKWMVQTGLVLLLPHGYEGNGPEHSSARIERFLQMCNDNFNEINVDNPKQHSNWSIVNCTTPANYFHVLQRQMARPYRKPLVIFTPKQLLRFPLSFSDLSDMGPGTKFLPLIGDDSILVNEKITKLVACSGKVYYDIIMRREQLQRDDVAVIRFEELFPFPYRSFQAQIRKYPNAKVVWCQEEPKNMGPWSYIESRIKTAYQDLGKDPIFYQPKYVGREPAAATATGKAQVHAYELETFLMNLFSTEKKSETSTRSNKNQELKEMYA